MEETVEAPKCEVCGEACVAHGGDEGAMCSCNHETCSCEHCTTRRG